jgi:hypothetical protein
MCTTSAGLERIVCEACGHLSFRWHEDVSDYIDRERIEGRPADTSAGGNDEGLFARRPRFGIRSRYELHPEPDRVPEVPGVTYGAWAT